MVNVMTICYRKTWFKTKKTATQMFNKNVYRTKLQPLTYIQA